MAIVDPNDPYAQLNPLAGYAPLPDAEEDLFRQWAEQQDGQSLRLPGELAKSALDIGNPSPPPPPPSPPIATGSSMGPRGRNAIDTGLPSYDEVANANVPASPTTEAAPAPSLAPSSVDATNLNAPPIESTPHLTEVSAAPQFAPPSPLAPPIPEPGTVDTYQPAAPSLSTFTPTIIQGGAPGSMPYGVPVKESDLRDEDLTPDQLYRRYLDEAHKDPIKYAKRIADYTNARNDKLAADLAENERKQREEAEARHAIFLKARDEGRAKRAQLDQDIADLGKQKIDANHWWATRTTAGKIGGWVAALVGGLVQGQTGAAHNEGLAGIQAAIDQDIEIQKANLANKRAALGEQRGSLQEQLAEQEQDEHDIEVRRITSYKSLADEMITAAQNFDPRSKTAIELTQNALAMESAGKKAADDYQQKVIAQKEKEAKQELELRKQTEVENARQANNKLDAWRISAGIKNDDRNYELQGKKLNAEIAKADKEGNTKEAEDLRKFGITVPGIRTPDGKIFKAQGDDKEVGELRAQLIGARMVVTLLDKARRLRTGYSSSVTDRKQWQELKQIWASLTFEGKNLFQLGAMSGDDYKGVNEFFGADDPTKAASIGPALDMARSNTLLKANQNVQGHDPFAGTANAANFDIPDPQANKAEESLDDKRQKIILDFGNTSGGKKELEAKTGYENTYGANTWINPLAQQYFDEYVADSQNADNPEKRAIAIERLHNIANNSRNTRLKNMARNAVNETARSTASEIIDSVPSATEEPASRFE